eukprot:CAMPEP_0194753190 /NCGR_PEP_ID=MMETSP0323_2-20130528/7140_1 /TAXON_ID=2866 ORGANISM="Crypthecodinium cohnii, Strain Seligo" /NCGR_SAMPLE_ID=MMETSP0323_2 /ASSEMBLY_ACC=CAM_ASM_000346 /LENGTH=59 /DNA_ID=CAMNT_0039670863 /DNA_START=115 /DNA_END=294 /DNA_ORIENTATION=-
MALLLLLPPLLLVLLYKSLEAAFADKQITSGIGSQTGCGKATRSSHWMHFSTELERQSN